MCIRDRFYCILLFNKLTALRGDIGYIYKIYLSNLLSINLQDVNGIVCKLSEKDFFRTTYDLRERVVPNVMFVGLAEVSEIS